MRRFFIGLLWAMAGCAAGAVAAYFLIVWFSTNTHDRSVEAAMTAAFVFGLLGAVIAFVIGFARAGRTPQRVSTGGRQAASRALRSEENQTDSR